MRSCGRRETCPLYCGHGRASETYRFSTYVGNLRVTRDTNVHKLAAALGQDPTEPLCMINGRASPTKAIVAGLAKALDSDVRFLDRRADEIRNDWRPSERAAKMGKSLTPPQEAWYCRAA
jgi:hypothetical protein